jgi:hypothetical protein
VVCAGGCGRGSLIYVARYNKISAIRFFSTSARNYKYITYTTPSIYR